ncbi:hypothetical protein [Streptomyces sp. NBC_00859]|uniref:hypothetical protein n=1 Tax=Streptomyces sp. NBC_00859 TaxID=2903682 RepID=UPI00386CF442|nr:hypothetical protein OG584_12505 [Streptomyces sp. NBC_00859]
MADERCDWPDSEWLDKDTAERLLRGEPVGAVDDRARAQAARLHAALDGAARAADRSGTGELPGEKVALEAFRLARDGGDPIGPVRPTGRAPGAVRWHRPARFSIAAVVAACALSGVAVAAGAGMLPSPFGRSEPMPASSVSSAATPRPLVSGMPSPTPGTASLGTAGPAPSGTPGAGQHARPPSASPGAGDSGRGGDRRGRSPSGGPAPAPGAGQQDNTTPSGGSHRSAADVYRKVAAACRDYGAGRVQGERRRSLESKAGGAAHVERFCRRVLGTGGSGDHRISFTPEAPLTPASPYSPPAGASPSPSPRSSGTQSPGNGHGGSGHRNR